MWECVPVRESVPQYGRGCPNVEGCAPLWESVPQCGRGCPIVEGGVPVSGRVFCSVGRCAPL